MNQNVIVAIAPIVLGIHIWYVKSRVQIERADAIKVLMENGEVDRLHSIVLYCQMMSRWIKEH
jgi:hypothetical protein